jgi:hypothetical protein
MAKDGFTCFNVIGNSPNPAHALDESIIVKYSA